LGNDPAALLLQAQLRLKTKLRARKTAPQASGKVIELDAPLIFRLLPDH